jgi:SAM-dependent methyltransferase
VILRRRRTRPQGLPRTVRWPLPPPGRPRCSWILGIRVRRWQLRRLLRPALPYLRTSRVIADLGAGTGADAEEFDRLVPPADVRSFLLVDAQTAMLRSGELARKSRSAPGWFGGPVVADVSRLPFRDGAADVVLSIGLLCCVDEAAIGRAVEESTRILAPGGILILGVPRWRGRMDERAISATGLVRIAGRRPGRGIFQKRL